MSWLHCNKCDIFKSSNMSIEYFCGSCGHVFCSTCNKHLSICPIDNRPLKGVPINDTMPQKLRTYFENPNNFLTSWQKSIRFQFQQRSRCESLQFTSTMAKLRQLKKEIHLFQKISTALDESNEKEMKRNAKMKTYLRNYFQKRGFPNRQADMSTSKHSFMSEMSLDLTSTHGESGVDLQFDEFDDSN